jgi:hypothetical protein
MHGKEGPPEQVKQLRLRQKATGRGRKSQVVNWIVEIVAEEVPEELDLRTAVNP